MRCIARLRSSGRTSRPLWELGGPALHCKRARQLLLESSARRSRDLLGSISDCHSSGSTSSFTPPLAPALTLTQLRVSLATIICHTIRLRQASARLRLVSNSALLCSHSIYRIAFTPSSLVAGPPSYLLPSSCFHSQRWSPFPLSRTSVVKGPISHLAQHPSKKHTCLSRCALATRCWSAEALRPLR